jgi:putative ABC transport system permease protein
MVGQTGAVTQVFIDLRRGVDAQQWIHRYGSTIGTGVTIEGARDVGGADFARRQLAAAGALLNVLGAAVLFIAGFLIYLTLSTAVVERVRLYGTLRSLGARRSQVRRLVVTEALIIGTSATVVGLLLGLGVAAGLIAASRRILENLSLGTTPLVVTPTAVLAAVALGMVTTIVSALLPARRASRLDPVEAMRGDYAADVRLSRTWMVGLASFVLGAGLLISSASVAAVGSAMPLFLFGSVTVVPLLLRALARVTGILTARIAKGVGDVAVLHLAKERTRSGYTLALVMVVMAVAIAIRATNDSYSASLDGQIEHEFRADFVIGSASTFPPGFSQQVERIQGVDVVAPFAIARSKLVFGSKSEPAQARFIDPERQWATGGFTWRDGSEAQAKTALERGGSVIFPFSTAQRHGLRRGDFVTMTTSKGLKRFRIAATAEIANSTPSAYFSWNDGRRLFGVSNPTFLYVTAKRGADVRGIRSKIENDLGSRTTLLVATLADIKKDVHAQIAGGLNAFFVLLVLAALLGLFGLTNTMAVSMLQRYREIGLLRAMGARKRQVRAMALVESSTLVGVAFLLAVPIGSFLSYPLVKFAARVVGDITVHYVFPWKLLPVLAVTGAIAAAVTAIGPARRATQLDIETALRFE